MKKMLTFLAVFGCISKAHAQSISHDRWRSNTIEFFFYQNGTGEFLFREAFAAALARWSVSTVTMKSTSDATGNTPCRVRPRGTRIVNVADIVASPPEPCGQFGARDLATTFTIRREDGEMVAADIFFRGGLMSVYDGPLQSRLDFRRIAVHELGHAAGMNLSGPNGEDTHDSDRNSIMYPQITDTFLPSQKNLSDLRTKYASPLPEPSPGDPNYKCSPLVPYQPVVELGTVSSTIYLLEQCLDRDSSSTSYFFNFGIPQNAKISVNGTHGGKSIELTFGNKIIWEASDSGDKTKSITRRFLAGRYQMRVSNGKTSGNFNGSIRISPSAP